MTSTWWRMSRWAVGSSRTRIGAVWATATATNTSCRSPSDSARASRSAQVARADPLDRGIDRRHVGRRATRAAAARAAGDRAPTTSSTVIAKGSWASSGTTAIERATALRSSPPSASPPSATDPRRGSSAPVRTRSRVDLPAPFGPTSAIRSPARERQVDVAQDRSRPEGHRDARRRQDPVGAHSSYPERDRCSRTRKNGAPRRAITTPTGMSPTSRATRSAAISSVAPTRWPRAG